jgi:hypothetical protein
MISPWWLIVCLAIFGIGVTKSGFGAGVGLMLVPMIALAMPHIPGRGYHPGDALGLMLPLLVAGDLLAVWQYRHLFSLDIVKKLLPGSGVGVVLGGVLLFCLKRAGSERVGAALVQMEIGFESVFLVGLHWYRLWRGKAKRVMREPARSHLTGGFAAVSSTLAHGAGPIVSLYLLPLDLSRQLFVGTCAIYFFILNMAKLPVFYVIGEFDHASLPFSLQFLPLVVAGAILGLWLNTRISDKWFSRIVYCVTFLLGWYILYTAIGDLVAATHRPL